MNLDHSISQIMQKASRPSYPIKANLTITALIETLEFKAFFYWPIPLAQRPNNFYKEYDELGQILSPVTTCMNNQFALSCITLLHLWRPLK